MQDLKPQPEAYSVLGHYIDGDDDLSLYYLSPISSHSFKRSMKPI